MVHCADGVPESDPNYAYLKGMQDMGATLTNEQTMLSKSGGPELFTYFWLNTIQDALSRYQVANRGIGLVQATLAGAGLVASDAACATGVGCAATAVSATTLTDYMNAGLMQAATGNTATPLGAQVLQSLGMSPEAAQILYGSLGIVASAVPSVVDSLTSNAAGVTTGAVQDGVVSPNPGKTTVYVSTAEDGTTQYVSITDNMDARSAAHLSQKGIEIDPIPGLQGISRDDARAVEQVLIEYNGLGKNGGSLLNKINSIATTNPIYANSLSRGAAILKSVEYPGFN